MRFVAKRPLFSRFHQNFQFSFPLQPSADLKERSSSRRRQDCKVVVMLTFYKKFSWLSLCMLNTFVVADIFSHCPGQLQFQDGPHGFGNSYRKGNRALVTHSEAFSFDGFHHTPKEYAGRVQLGLTIRDVDDIPGNLFSFGLMLKNDDTKVRHLQVALSGELEKEPLALYTIEAAPGALELPCIVVGTGWERLNITIQAF